MPDMTILPSMAIAPGYSARDAALQDILFGPDLDDETPEGPTRTWVYSEGEADDAGRFETVEEPDTGLILRQPVLQLVRIDDPRAAEDSFEPLPWALASPARPTDRIWPTKTF